MPLIARGVVLGCVTFGRAPRSPAFGPADIAAAGELASRAAVCIDNARLYHRERRTAFALQQGLLPGEPQVPAGMEVAHRYLPVGASMVGGDWHDIVALPGGRAALIVGDAMGHGPEAAAVMVQLRTAAHTLADLELPPGEVLAPAGPDGRRHARRAVSPPACAPVIDPARELLRDRRGRSPAAGAGPGRTARTEVLDLPAGLPLGLGAGSFEAARVSLPPGATLALYTDGLVESRTRPLEDGMAALRDALGAALARPGATLDGACEAVTQALRQRGEDDITLVLARIRRQAGPVRRRGLQAPGLGHVVAAQVGGVDPDPDDRARGRVTEPLRGRDPSRAGLRLLRVAPPLPEPGRGRPRPRGRFAGGGVPSSGRSVTAAVASSAKVRGEHDADPPAHLIQVQLPPGVVLPQQAQQSFPVGVADQGPRARARAPAEGRRAPLASGAGDDRRAVGHDLGELLAHLRGVEPHRDDRVRAQQPRVLDHAVDRVPAAVLEQLGVLGHLALAHAP